MCSISECEGQRWRQARRTARRVWGSTHTGLVIPVGMAPVTRPGQACHTWPCSILAYIFNEGRASALSRRGGAPQTTQRQLCPKDGSSGMEKKPLWHRGETVAQLSSMWFLTSICEPDGLLSSSFWDIPWLGAMCPVTLLTHLFPKQILSN